MPYLEGNENYTFQNEILKPVTGDCRIPKKQTLKE